MRESCDRGGASTVTGTASALIRDLVAAAIARN
jgi:hypothetical protein